MHKNLFTNLHSNNRAVKHLKCKSERERHDEINGKKREIFLFKSLKWNIQITVQNVIKQSNEQFNSDILENNKTSQKQLKYRLNDCSEICFYCPCCERMGQSFHSSNNKLQNITQITEYNMCV